MVGIWQLKRQEVERRILATWQDAQSERKRQLVGNSPWQGLWRAELCSFKIKNLRICGVSFSVYANILLRVLYSQQHCPNGTVENKWFKWDREWRLTAIWSWGSKVMIHSEEKDELKNISESQWCTHGPGRAGHTTGELRDGHGLDPIYPKYIFRIY